MITDQTPAIVADLALSRRLERAEGLGNAGFVEARNRAFPELGAACIEVGGTYALFDGVDSPCTQTFGLGMFEPATAANMERLEEFFRERGAKVFHEVSPLADASALKLLNERGYQPIEFSSVMYRPIQKEGGGIAGLNPSIQVRRVGAEEAGVWARTASRGWLDVAPEIENYMVELQHIYPYQRDTHWFLAEKEGEAIAAGALGVYDGVALFAGACTVPEHRKQGAQRALLAHRLQFAAEHGCDIAMIVARPGSGSQRNSERQGFRIAYTRIKWERTPGRAGG